MSIIKSVKGFFGEIIHYKDGVRVGTTTDSFIPGVKNHYDARGNLTGYSTQGIFADEVHFDRNSQYIGSSHEGAFGATHHYSKDGSHSVSCDGLFGTNTYIDDDSDALFSSSDDFFSDSPSFGDSNW